MQRHLATFKESANGHGELFAAVSAEVQARAVAFTLERAVMFYAATMRADRAIKPADRFKKLAGCVFVGKTGSC